MSIPFTVQKTFGVGGLQFGETQTITANFGYPIEVSVNAAQAGTLASGGTTTSGSITMTNSGHGITTSALVDVYWTGGRLLGATVGTVSGTTVPITASGTFEDGTSALPANATAMIVCVCKAVNLNIVGNSMQALVQIYLGSTGTSGSFGYYASSTLDYQIGLLTGVNYAWYVNNGETNPLAGVTITKVLLSHNDTTGAQTMRVGVASN